MYKTKNKSYFFWGELLILQIITILSPKPKLFKLRFPHGIYFSNIRATSSSSQDQLFKVNGIS